PRPPGSPLFPYTTLFRSDTVLEREQGVVLADADVVAGVVLGAALADDDVAGEHELAAVALHAEAFRFRVAAVARATTGFFVCHEDRKSTRLNSSHVKISY